MNKTEFIEKLSSGLDMTKAEAGRCLDKVLKCVVTSMRDHNELKFIGFGTFKAKNKEATEVKTPRGTMAKVPAQRRVSFSVGSEFKATVNGK